MVTTRRMSAAEAQLRREVENSPEDCTEGSKRWFQVKEGLNGYGFIPGTNLGDDQCSREEYVKFWGHKNYHNGGRYKRRVSPRMVRRIRYLYQRCFQRPVGASDAIPYHFGRGLLAEKNGHPVNWASYARKMTHRGTGDVAHLGITTPPRAELRRQGNVFEFVSMEGLRKKTSPDKWPKNEAGAESEDEEGSLSDWEVNVQFQPDAEDVARLVRIIPTATGADMRGGEKNGLVPELAPNARGGRPGAVAKVGAVACAGNPEDECLLTPNSGVGKFEVVPGDTPNASKENSVLGGQESVGAMADSGHVGEGGPHPEETGMAVEKSVDGSGRQEMCTCGTKRPWGFLSFVKKERVENSDVNGTAAISVKTETWDGNVAPQHRSEATNSGGTSNRQYQVPSNRGKNAVEEGGVAKTTDAITEASWKRAYLANVLPASGSTTSVPGTPFHVQGTDSATPAGLTLGDCHEYVALKIRRGMEVHQQEMELLKKLYAEFELDMGAMKMQELRVDFMTREYEIEKAVARHVRTTKGVDAREGVPPPDELEALRKKTEAEAICVTARTVATEKGAKINRIEKELLTRERVLSVWVENPTDRARRLCELLASEDILEASAFQLAGLDCRCTDANCDFPFVIDDLHRHL